MKNILLPTSCLTAGVSILSIFSASAGVILRYDSVTANTTDLSVVGTTDTALISAADPTTSIDGNGTIKAGPHPSQTNVQGTVGTGNDLHFRFGGNGTAINYPLVAANVATGHWIGTDITAAQTISLDELSFQLFANSQNGSLFSARDVGLFVSLDGGTSFTQFGDLDLTGSTGNQGVVTFSDSLTIASGQEAQLRLLFSDKTSLASNLQASTRVGDIIISGTPVPEPSTALLGGLSLLGLLRRRRA